jgi:hypothetical protein
MRDSIAVRWTLATLLLGFVPGGLAAQSSTDNTGYGTTAAEFLLLGANARGAALGTPFAAIANDVGALYYNPAGIALSRGAGFQVSTYEYVADTRYSWGGIVLPFGGKSKAFGVHLGTFGFGDQPVYTVEQPDGTGSVYSVNQTYVGATYAQNFSDRFSAGLTGKVILDQLGDAKGSAFAVDFGTNFHSTLGGHPIQFSFTLQNLGSDISYSGTALNVDVPRDSVPGVPSVPNIPQPGQYRTKSWSLPTVFRVALAYDIQPADEQQGRLRLRHGSGIPQPRRDRVRRRAPRQLQPPVGQQRRHPDARYRPEGRREPPGRGVRWRPVLPDPGQVPGGPRLRLPLHGHSRRHQLLLARLRVLTLMRVSRAGFLTGARLCRSTPEGRPPRVSLEAGRRHRGPTPPFRSRS